MGLVPTAVHKNCTAYIGSKYQVWILFVLKYLSKKAFQAQANPLHLTLLFARTDGNTSASITEFVYKSLILEGLTSPPRFSPCKETLCVYLFKTKNQKTQKPKEESWQNALGWKSVENTCLNHSVKRRNYYGNSEMYVETERCWASSHNR